MKTLKEQLEEKMLISDFMYEPITQESHHYNMPYRYSIRTMEEFCDINDIDIDNITEEQVEYFYENINRWGLPTRSGDYRNESEWIRESLTSHSKQKLIKKLEDIFKGIDHIIYEDGTKIMKNGVIAIGVDSNCEIFHNSIEKDFKLNNCKLSEEIYSVLTFYNYYITLVENTGKTTYIYLEPIYTELANDEIKQNGNIIYHITKFDKVPDILKKGLRPKVGKLPSERGGYRYFPKRLFLIYHSKDIVNDIKTVILDKGYNAREYRILKINLKNHNLNFWRDDASSGEHNVYTMDSIPPKLIEVVKLEDIR